MNYQDWLTAVDQALKSLGKAYSSKNIDPAHLQNAFSQSVSPVLYARQPVHPMIVMNPVYSYAPLTPAATVAGVPKFLIGLCYYGMVSLGGVMVLVSLYFLLALLMAGAQRQQETPGNSMATVAMLTLMAPFLTALAGGFVLIAIGVSVRLLASIAKHPGAP